MAAKIGILGQTTDVSLTTTTLYTVGGDKAARVRGMAAIEGGAAEWEWGLTMGTPNDELLIHMHAGTSGDDSWTGSRWENTQDPTDSVLQSVNGLQDANDVLDMSNCNAYGDWIIAPLSADYFISTGDTVKLQVTGVGGVDGYVNVQGVEDDA